MIAIQLIYIAVTSTISFCIYTNQYLEPCNYAVAVLCFIDYLFHFLHISRIKHDIILHHVFALSNILYLYVHLYPVTRAKEVLAINFLSTEISTIFLSVLQMRYDLPKDVVKKYERVFDINNIAFVLTFIYYRIYNYFVNIIASTETNMMIITLSKNNYYMVSFYVSTYGLFALNLYWMGVILRRVARKIH